MDGPVLSLDKMAAGDVLFLEDTNEATHLGIAVAQSLLSHHKNASANVTHTGIYDTLDHSICEASGAAGLRRMPLAVKHPGYKFQVFRLIDNGGKVIRAAIRIANELIASKLKHQADKAKEKGVFVYSEKGGDNYDKDGCFVGGSVKSSDYGKGAKEALEYMNTRFQRDMEGQKLPDWRFYCSNFVAAVYQLAELEATKRTTEKISAIRLDYRNVSPKTLQGYIRSNDWKYIGNYFVPEPEDGVKPTETNLWSPYAFDRETYHKSKLPDVFKQIHFQLENYHGLPFDDQTLPIRRNLLTTLGRTTMEAMYDESNADRYRGLEELLKQINQDLDDFSGNVKQAFL